MMNGCRPDFALDDTKTGQRLGFIRKQAVADYLIDALNRHAAAAATAAAS